MEADTAAKKVGADTQHVLPLIPDPPPIHSSTDPKVGTDSVQFLLHPKSWGSSVWW